MIKIFQRLKCLIGEHEWTTASDKGVAPTTDQLNSGAAGFFSYAKMYCKHCGVESDISKKWRKGKS